MYCETRVGLSCCHCARLHVHMYVKAVGNKGVIGDKMSSRTFCASVQEDHLVSHLEKTRGPYGARITLDCAPLSARGGHTNRHSECSPAQGFWPQRQLLLPERRSDLLEQEQKSVCGMLSWSPLTTSRSAPVPGTRFCSCTSVRHFRRPRCLGP